MVTLRVYGSSSKGNCFELSSSTTNILLDCGLSNKYVETRIKNIAGILITHLHLDHTKGIKKIKDYYNYKYYSNEETLDTIGVLHCQKQVIEEGRIFEINDFAIMPFEVYHDVKNFGYLIKEKNSGLKILYIIDTSSISNLHFKDIDVFIIEANHSWQWLAEKEQMDFKDYRTYGEEGHLDIESCIEFLQLNANHNTKKIILTHISSSFENYEQFADIVKQSLDLDVEVYAVNPKLQEPLEIVLQEDLDFDFN